METAGNNSLATITASHRGTVWNLGAFSSVVRVSRTRSMTSPSEERPDPSASSTSSPPNEAGISRHHPGSDHSLDAAEHGVEQRAEGFERPGWIIPGNTGGRLAPLACGPACDLEILGIGFSPS